MKPPLLTLCFLFGCHSGQQGLVQTNGVGSVQPMDFGRVVIGEVVQQPLVISNLGGGVFDFTGPPSVTGPASSSYQVVTDPYSSVPDGLSVAATMQFAPTSPGTLAAQVDFSTDSKATPQLSATLTGEGVSPASLSVLVQPEQLDFGSVHVSQTRTLTVAITNEGTDTAPVQPLTLSGLDAASFTVAGDFFDGGGHPLNAGETLSMAVTFVPATSGPASAILDIKACRLCMTEQVALSGVGLDGMPTFVPQALGYGSVRRGDSLVLPISLVNNGNDWLSVSEISITEGDDFTIVFGYPDGGSIAPFPLALQPGQNYDFGAAYSPSSTESIGAVDTGMLGAVWTSGDAGPSVVSASLSGVAGPQCILVAPTSLFFGYADPPYYSPRGSVSITNSGRDTCHVSHVGIGSNSDPSFQLLTVPPMIVVSAGSSVQLALIFSPSDVGPPWLRTGSLIIESDDPVNPSLIVALSGFTQSTAYTRGSAWPRYGHDSGNSNLSSVNTSDTQSNLRWKTYIAPPPRIDFDTPFYASGPSIGPDGVLYELGWDGNIYAIEPDAGLQLWSSPAAQPGSTDWAPFGPGSPPVSTPSVGADGTVYVLGNAYADASGGTLGLDQLFGFGSDGGNLFSFSSKSTLLTTSPIVNPDKTVLI